MITYLKNKRIAKREMAKLMATTLPLVNKVMDKNSGIATTVLELIESCNGMTGEKLRKEFINGLAEVIHNANQENKATE